jgi:hypothetical protein
LVAFYKSPNERVDITKPGQTLNRSSGGGFIAVQVALSAGGFAPVLDENGVIVKLRLLTIFSHVYSLAS